MSFEIRKIVVFKEEILVDGGRPLARPVTMVGVAAVLANPWYGRGFVEDLLPEQITGCAPLGRLLASRVVEEIGGSGRIEAYGKAAVVGLGGEIEHAAALIHNLRFGDAFRKAVGAESFLAFTNRRAGPGDPVQMPMKHLSDAGGRSHFLTLEFSVPAAPDRDEALVILGASTGPRPHARIGDRRKDAEQLRSGASSGTGGEHAALSS